MIWITLGERKNVPITIDQNEVRRLICLEGEIGVSSAAELKRLLLEALASGKEVWVDLERATEMDVTALQLFWAAEREAKESGTRFALLGGVPAEISSALHDAGFDKFPIPADAK